MKASSLLRYATSFNGIHKIMSSCLLLDIFIILDAIFIFWLIFIILLSKFGFKFIFFVCQNIVYNAESIENSIF